MNKGLNNLLSMAGKLSDNVAEAVNTLNLTKNDIKKHIPDNFADDFNEVINISNQSKKAFGGTVDPNDLLKNLKKAEAKINKKVKDAS